MESDNRCRPDVFYRRKGQEVGRQSLDPSLLSRPAAGCRAALHLEAGDAGRAPDPHRYRHNPEEERNRFFTVPAVRGFRKPEKRVPRTAEITVPFS